MHIFNRWLAGVVALWMVARVAMGADAAMQASYQDLVRLHEEWRTFERPPLREGAPDYTAATLARKHKELAKYQARLAALPTDGWSVEQQIDYRLVRAEMNGLDFDIRVLKPWARDP